MVVGALSHVHWKRCPQFFDPGHTGSSSFRRIEYEPPHVHVEREESEAKFWIDPVRLERSRGFGRTELRRMEALIVENGAFLVRAWHEYFGN